MAWKSRPSLDLMKSLFQQTDCVPFLVTCLVSQSRHGRTPNHGTGKACYFLKVNLLRKTETLVIPTEILIGVSMPSPLDHSFLSRETYSSSKFPNL